MRKILPIFISFVFVLGSASFASEEPVYLKSRCGIENCHGLDIICGENVPEMCTSIYKFGDRCRQYVKCGIVDGKCTLIAGKEFEECKTCIEKCQETFKEDMRRGFECEGGCGQ